MEGVSMIAADIGLGDIFVYVIAGAIIGALARLIVPGKQSMGWVITIVLGVIAAIVGGILWNAVFPDNEGVAWIGSIVVAVVLVFLYVKFFDTTART
jgi:uncharacterized membrane protein YeaQ/YmgE (transglycosylase-associated protein family)